MKSTILGVLCICFGVYYIFYGIKIYQKYQDFSTILRAIIAGAGAIFLGVILILGY
ncbi:MAG: hypothetical protein H6576_10755 [Lewinellaceae bacterium]|nr:hypothetical protein [Lewinellaceae bacterium]